MEEQVKMEKAYGNVKEFISPSGYKFTIREQNGNDDDVLSNMGAVQDGSTVNNFVKGIVVKTDFNQSGRLTNDDMLKMKLRDKYSILLMSRAFSLGWEINFEYDWGKDNGGVIPYVEDLHNYLWDFSREMPEDLNDIPETMILPYVGGKETSREISLTSGKVVRYEYLNGKGEKYLMSLTRESMSKNQELVARDIHLKDNEGKFVKVQNFTPFSTRDMMEIRKDVLLNDAETSYSTEIENPKTSEKVFFPLLTSPDFFFPTGI